MNHRPRDEDPLSRRAREVEELARRAQAEAAAGSGRPGFVARLGELFRAAERFNKLYDQLAAFLNSLRRYTGVLGDLIAWLAGLIGRWLKWAAFERENGEFKRDAEGDLIFSGPRLMKSLAGTLALLVTLHVGLSAAYFYLTQFQELVYTTGKQEIVTGELYQFTGCTSLPCSTDEDNGKFYEIESSWYFPHLIYPEENVYANIPQQDAACYVKGFGIYFRKLKALHKSMQWYQKAYSVSCRPYTEAEKQRAVTLGTVVMPEDGK
ncbi:MAG: hypothetical protein P8178_00780 [Candidatus Thiodiazotropha sp.]